VRRVASPQAPARGPKRQGKGKSTGEVPGSYHHGALRDALLTAAERILERDGVSGLTLRAAAREAGVSHAAPTHHFGDLTGLVSDLAAIGFERFRAGMIAAAEGISGADARLDAMGGAYLAFARAHPGMFTLMFRSERLDKQRTALREAMDAAGAALAEAVGARRHETIPKAAPSLVQAAEIVRAWSIVHGYAVLLLDGRLGHFIERLPSGEDESALFRAVLSPPQHCG
jgi:AcrR family transcriptional regulator